MFLVSLLAPTHVLLGVLAKVAQIIGVHNAATLRRSAGLAVGIFSGAASLAIPLVALTICVFVRSIKNMSNFVSENPVNLIGTPTVIAVLHVQRSATKVSICEMALLVLGEETKESTISTTTVFNILCCSVPSSFTSWETKSSECRISKLVVARWVARARGWVGSTDSCLPIIHHKRQPNPIFPSLV